MYSFAIDLITSLVSTSFECGIFVYVTTRICKMLCHRSDAKRINGLEWYTMAYCNWNAVGDLF